MAYTDSEEEPFRSKVRGEAREAAQKKKNPEGTTVAMDEEIGRLRLFRVTWIV